VPHTGQRPAAVSRIAESDMSAFRSRPKVNADVSLSAITGGLTGEATSVCQARAGCEPENLDGYVGSWLSLTRCSHLLAEDLRAADFRFQRCFGQDRVERERGSVRGSTLLGG
jgi:hypothetical protein